MDQYYEKCEIMETHYIASYSNFRQKLLDIEAALDNDADKIKFKAIKQKYMDTLLTEEDLRRLRDEKNTIVNEYKEFREMTENKIDDINKVAVITKKMNSLIENTEIDSIKEPLVKEDPASPAQPEAAQPEGSQPEGSQPEAAQPEAAQPEAADNKIIQPSKGMNTNIKSLNSLNTSLGGILKGTHADEFSKVLENFKFSHSDKPVAAVTPVAAPPPIINVSPVQVVQLDKKCNKPKVITKYIVRYKTKSKKKTKTESNKKTKTKSNKKNKKKPVVVVEEKKKPSRKMKPASVAERSFTIVNISKHGGCKTKFNEGRFINRNPAGAAKKAFNEHCRVKNIRGVCVFHITMKETTRGSDGDIFSYKLRRNKLKKPIIRFEGTSKQFEIEYKTEIKSVDTPTTCTRPGQTPGPMKHTTARKTKPVIKII
jgi:hypothetical protein